MVPSVVEFRTPTSANPPTLAASRQRVIARMPTTGPKPLSASSRANGPRSWTTRICGVGLIPPACKRRTVFCSRATLKASNPAGWRRVLCRRASAAAAASAAGTSARWYTC